LNPKKLSNEEVISLLPRGSGSNVHVVFLCCFKKRLPGQQALQTKRWILPVMSCDIKKFIDPLSLRGFFVYGRVIEL
jgi:hypothetical protein